MNRTLKTDKTCLSREEKGKRSRGGGGSHSLVKAPEVGQSLLCWGRPGVEPLVLCESGDYLGEHCVQRQKVWFQMQHAL